ncbi:VIT1/CCC1 transporter family protein [Candidatus Uhrbacteria bacterium]|nr:VIT1/CCC1 transporter family protein [Candidatus Uhrbacteria bacterium]
MATNNQQKSVAGSMREIVFGLEDGLVSTLGAVTGIAAGANDRFIVILSGLVLVAVESLSMAAGSYLSSKSAADAESVLDHRHKHQSLPLRAAWVMGVCYVFGGVVPVVPYFFLPVAQSYAPSILSTLFVLFLVGVWSGKQTRRPPVRNGIKMVMISTSAAILGFLIGRLVSYYFHIEINA